MDGIARYQGVDKTSTAYKLLSSMGWQEGEGLGAQKQGIASHVKVKRKADASGVGAAQAAATAKDWTLGMAAYDRVLATLRAKATSPQSEETISEPPKKKRKKDKGAAELPVGSEPARQSSKDSRKAKSKGKAVKEAPTLESEATEIKEEKKAATHVGRFHKVARNKHVKGYSSTDLAAILGACGAEEEWPGSKGSQEAQPSTAKVSPCKAAAHTQLREGEGEESQGSDVAETLGLWWHGHFVQAGRGGSGYTSFASEVKREVKVAGFSEEDQANLWQNVTDAQSKAKRGVGQGSALGAVAGARWAGRKTKIGDSDEEEGTQEGKGSPEEITIEAEVGAEDALIVPSKRKQAEVLAAVGDGGSAEALGGQPNATPKWKKIAQSILKASDRSELSIKAFKAKAWEIAEKKGCSDKKAALQNMMECLTASKQFDVGRKTISCRR